MGLFSSKSSSATTSNTYNTSSQGTVGIEGSSNQSFAGLTSAGAQTLNLSDFGAIQQAFEFAKGNQVSVEKLLEKTVNDGQAARAELLSFATNLKAEAQNAGSKNQLYLVGGVLLVAAVAIMASR